MAYEGISIEVELKKKLDILRGERTWNEFFQQEIMDKKEGGSNGEICCKDK